MRSLLSLDKVEFMIFIVVFQKLEVLVRIKSKVVSLAWWLLTGSQYPLNTNQIELINYEVGVNRFKLTHWFSVDASERYDYEEEKSKESQFHVVAQSRNASIGLIIVVHMLEYLYANTLDQSRFLTDISSSYVRY